jgi:hypothetical protein
MAPFIAAMVAELARKGLGKVGEAVMNKGVEYVEDKLGVKLEPELSPEKVAEIQLKAQEFEEFRIKADNENTADARDMQKVALQQDDLFSKRFVYYLASFWSLVAVIYVGLITFMTIPEANVRFADTILGFLLGTVIATIFNFFLGSSQSSKDKTKMLTDSTKQGE